MPQAPAWPCAVRECRKWSVFEAHLDNITDTVTSYISFCENVGVPTKTFCVYNNNKPWFTGKLRKYDAYRSEDQARNILTKEIRVAKRRYTETLKMGFQLTIIFPMKHSVTVY